MREDLSIKEFYEQIPKAELHLHIEGTFEPELMFEIAQRNAIELKYKTVEDLKKAYNFSNLQDFLDIYYEGAGVLIKEVDFYDLTMAYLTKVNSENVTHVEIMFDPQTHTERGVSFDTVINGIWKALKEAELKWGMTSCLIMSYLRHLDEESAFKTLESGLKHKDKITAVGLDSSELGNPPSKFKKVYEKSIEEGFISIAHAGEEGPAEYITEALDLLKVKRIDHGNRCLEDEKVTKRLVDSKMCLTVCPLSNLELRVVKDMKDHPLLKMLGKGLKVTVNSDDPAYFGGYMNANFEALHNALNLSKSDIFTLNSNSFEYSFLDEETKHAKLMELHDFTKLS